MIRPRFLARLCAFLGGYFWLPCPICGKYFAGFETSTQGLVITQGLGQCVCSHPECVAAAKKQTDEFVKKLPQNTSENTMTEEQLREIEEIEKHATAGPWAVRPTVTDRYGTLADCIIAKGAGNLTIADDIDIESGDAAFIAAARSFVPEAIRKIRRLWKEKP